jgi:hypothetical protein
MQNKQKQRRHDQGRGRPAVVEPLEGRELFSTSLVVGAGPGDGPHVSATSDVQQQVAAPSRTNIIAVLIAL